MSVHIEPIQCFQTNYSWLLYDDITRKAVAVDPGEAEPVLKRLENEGLMLDAILITHCHSDHTGGIRQLSQHFKCQVYAPAKEEERIPEVTDPVQQAKRIDLFVGKADIIETPGHTSGSVCYYFPELKAVFTGDTLFSMGCGRLFEGSPRQMFESLQKLKGLPEDTMIYAAHEYTEENARFALTLFPDSQALLNRLDTVRKFRKAGRPTLPVALSTEMQTNPFLMARNSEEFTKIRKLKDMF